MLAELDEQVKPGGVSPVYRAATLAALGRKEEAMDALEEGSAPGAGGESEWLNVDPRYEVLRPDPRFQRLSRMEGFIP